MFLYLFLFFFFFKQKTAYEMRISDWSSDVCSSDLLRNRMARIRVFDPACGSGNFLVIAYQEIRAIEAIINERRGEKERKSDLPLTNFRGVELRDRSEEHTSELQSLMRTSYAVFCFK